MFDRIDVSSGGNDIIMAFQPLPSAYFFGAQQYFLMSQFPEGIFVEGIVFFSSPGFRGFWEEISRVGRKFSGAEGALGRKIWAPKAPLGR